MRAFWLAPRLSHSTTVLALIKPLTQRPTTRNSNLA